MKRRRTENEKKTRKNYFVRIKKGFARSDFVGILAFSDASKK